MSATAVELANQWDFSPIEELPGGWCSHVYADPTRVLKCPWRGEEQTSGYRAALAMSGWFGPEVIESDSDSGGVLMSRVLPGHNLAQVKMCDHEAASIVAELIQSMQGRIPSDGYPSLGEYHALSHPLLDLLLTTSRDPVFLHGDLQHQNILWNDRPRKWIPIDPKGIWGDPDYEAIAFLRNQTGHCFTATELQSLIQARLDFFADCLGFDPWRMAAWGLIDQLDSGEDQNKDLVAVYEQIVGIHDGWKL